MTKLKLTLIAMTFLGFAQAQSFKISAGYGFPWISQQIGTNTSTVSTTTLDPATNTDLQRTTYTSQNVKGSFGAGWNIGGAYVYEFSKNLNLELGLSYVVGKKYDTQSAYSEVNSGVAENLHVESETSKSRAFLFTPMLKFMVYDRRRPVTPYFFAGPVLSKVNFSRDLKQYVEENGSVSTESRSTKFNGGISLGIRGGAGVNIKMNKKMSFFSEISFTGMNYYPKDSEITKYTVNGENNISSLTQNVLKTMYVNKVTTDSQHTPEEINSPGKSLRFPVAMSSINLNVGVLIRPK
jgi:hypothetical protein